MPKKLKKPKQQTLLQPEPRVKRVEDISGGEFLILCSRAADGEVHMERFGHGSTPSLWWVEYTENNEIKNEIREPESNGSESSCSFPHETDEPTSDAPVAEQEHCAGGGGDGINEPVEGPPSD